MPVARDVMRHRELSATCAATGAAARGLLDRFHDIGRAGPQVGLDDFRVALDLRRRPFGDLEPVVEHGHLVGDAHDDFHVVLDEEDGQVEIATQAVDEAGHLRRLLRIHPRGWLVEEEQLGLAGEGPRDLQAALVAVGEILGGHRTLAAQSDVVEELPSLGAGLTLLPVDRGETQHRAERRRLQPAVHADENVIQRRHVGEEPDILKRAGDPARGHLIRSQPAGPARHASHQRRGAHRRN